MSVPPNERSTRVGDWPEALAWFDRWAAADAAGRQDVLAELQAQRPALVRQVHAMIDAEQAAEAQNAPGDDGRWCRGWVVPPAPLPDEHQPGLRLGPWELQHAIGRGGMGQVWLATRRDGLYSGRAAVKLLNAASLGTQAQARFAREGELLARLSHPHIAKLLDAGFTPQGTRYLVLEYVQGERLDQWCDARRLGVPERLRLFMQVCDAVTFAHANLVVHRDLKPANILVCDGQGGGQVKLLDFGIAKLLGDSDSGEALTELTRFGFAGMTPEYAAPEQVEDGTITTATDVYALGVVLFGLLTGTRPYGETSRGAAALARAIVEQPARALTAAVADDPALARARGAPSPLALKELLRGDLETIVAKALKKLPAERYATVRALQDDIQRHLNLEPVSARPDSWRYRATRFAQRNRLPVAASGVALVALLGGVTTATWQWRAAAQEAERTRAVVQVLTGIFTQLTPEATGSAQVPVVELLRRGWRGAEKSLAGDPELKGEVARPLGMMLQSSGDMESAASALSTSRAHLQASGRTHTAPYLEVTQELGVVLSRLGRNAEARRLFQDVIDTARAVPGPIAAETVYAQVQLGVLARREGRLDEARHPADGGCRGGATRLRRVPHQPCAGPAGTGRCRAGAGAVGRDTPVAGCGGRRHAEQPARRGPVRAAEQRNARCRARQLPQCGRAVARDHRRHGQAVRPGGHLHHLCRHLVVGGAVPQRRVRRQRPRPRRGPCAGAALDRARRAARGAAGDGPPAPAPRRLRARRADDRAGAGLFRRRRPHAPSLCRTAAHAVG